MGQRTEATLGKLVAFEKRREEGRPAIRKEGQAEILLFTGVRYQRHSTEPGKPPASAGSKRKRG